MNEKIESYIELFNGKAARPSTMGSFPIYGSNGVIGLSDAWNYENAIVLGRVGAYCGSVAIVKEKFWASDNTIVLKTRNTADLEFFFHLLSNLELNNISGGSAQPLLTQSFINNLELEIPDEANRKLITDSLELISKYVNSKLLLVNKSEEMIKTAYSFWFEQLNFPTPNNDFFANSGGKLTWDSSLNRNVPEGWEIVELKDLVTEPSKKYDFKSGNTNFDVYDLSTMPSDSICLVDSNEVANFKSNLYHAEKYDLFFGSIRPYLHKAGFAPNSGLVTGTVHNFRPIDMNNLAFLVCLISSKSFFKFAVDNSKGTKMPIVSKQDLLRYRFPFNPEIARKFSDCFGGLSLIADLISEIKIVRSVESVIAPHVLSGAIKLH